MKRLPWLKMRKKTDPELPYQPPIWLGNHSNGEYFHPSSPRDRKIRKLILEKAADNARRIGMDRRDFLASAMGMCTSLWALNVASGCSEDGSSGKNSGAKGSGGGPGRDGGSGSGGRSGYDAGSGGSTSMEAGAGGSQGSGGAECRYDAGSAADARYCVPEEAMFDPNVACTVVGGNEFIFDIQTHWFDKDDLAKFPLYLNAFGGLFNVATEDNYIRQLFCESDTTMTALTSWPSITCTGCTTINCGLPLSNESMVKSRAKINDLAYSQRVVNHIQIMVQDPVGVEPQLEIMQEVYCQSGAHAWKLYPGFKPPFSLDDPRGRRVIEHGLGIGLPVFCVHKGLPIGAFFDVDGGNHPREVGIVAKDYPEAKFIIYHSGICTGFDATSKAPPEGPYDPDVANPTGVNAFIRSLLDNGVTPNSNVYAEVGSALNQVFKDPAVAAHFFGKLMKYVGVDNVCWGTDCIIYGTPQPFIEQFRALEIPQSMQEEFGYPPLDAAQKAKIFGLNAAKAYGVDPEAKRCEIDTCPTAELKRHMDGELGKRRWTFDEPSGPRTWEEFVAHDRSCVELGQPG